jgi:hypothetical protein
MGQYLAMGIAYEIKTSRDVMNKKNISNEELRQQIEQDLLFDLELYDEEETEKTFFYTLKDQVLETCLIPFLEVFYPMVYKEQQIRECHDLLNLLRSTPSSTWVDIAQEKEYMPFRFDEYAESRYIRFFIIFQPSICLNFNYFMLYMGYGKISTEGMYDFLNFFKSCMNETFKDHPIAKSMQIYISG